MRKCESCTDQRVLRGRVLAVILIAGAAVGAGWPVHAGTALAWAVATGTLAWAVRSRGIRTGLVALSLAGVTAAHAARAKHEALHPPLARWLLDAESRGPTGPVLVEGVLVEDAQLFDRSARLHIAVQAIRDGPRWRPIRGRIDAYVGGDLVPSFAGEWSAGRTVHAPIVLRRPPVRLNPGGPGEPWQRLSRQADLTGSIKSALLVTVTRGPWWDEVAAAIRRAVRRAMARLYAPDRTRTAALVNAILIGDRAGLDDEVRRRLQAAGTFHVVAISGGNVALLTAWCVLGLQACFRSFRTRSTLAALAVLGYGWVVGGDPSVTRAVTAAVVYLTCGVVGLVPAALDVLGLVAVLVVVVDPLSVLDAGAWLSFGATLGIIVLAPGILARLRCGIAASTARRGLNLAAGILAATIAAELILLPVNATVFSRVGLAGLLLNFVAVPMMAVVQAAGAAAVALSACWPAGAGFAGLLAHGAASALVDSARLVDVVPWISWRVPPPSLVTVATYYVAGVVWTRSSARSTACRVSAVAAGTCALLVATAPGTHLRAPAPGWVRLTMFDVGQGESLLLQFPTGQSLLIDAGGRTGGFDAGERVVTPAVWASGERRPDWLAVTHADLDHIGGAVSAVGALGIREVWEGVPVPPDTERVALKEAVRRRRGVWRQLQRGDRLELGDVDVLVLNPPVPDWERRRVRNDDSIVLSVRFDDVELLLTGDIGEEVERQLVPPSAANGHPAIRILKVAHHGSRTSSAAGWLAAYRPHLALVSAGRGNPFGHPSPEALDRLRAVGAPVFRTDRDGAVIVETDGRVVRVHATRGRTWTMRVSRPAA